MKITSISGTESSSNNKVTLLIQVVQGQENHQLPSDSLTQIDGYERVSHDCLGFCLVCAVLSEKELSWAAYKIYNKIKICK